MAIFKIISEVYKTEDDMRNLIRYVTHKAVYWDSSLTVFNSNKELMTNQMSYIKSYYGKKDGNQMMHMVLSADSCKYEKNIDITAMKKIGEIFCNLFHEYQSIYGIHNDTKNLHLHFIFNTVGWRNGMRYHCSPGEFTKLRKILAQELGEIGIALAYTTWFDENGKLQYEALGPWFSYMNKSLEM